MSADRPLVLIIDDDPHSVDILTATLTQTYEVIAASDGLDGYALACERRPTVIVLDVLMPLVDGWTVLRKLRFNPATANARVVIITAADQADVRREAEKLRVFEVIHKPASVSDVRKLVARAIAASRPSVV